MDRYEIEQFRKNDNLVEKQETEITKLDIGVYNEKNTDKVKEIVISTTNTYVYPSGRSSTNYGSLYLSVGECRKLATQLIEMIEHAAKENNKS